MGEDRAMGGAVAPTVLIVGAGATGLPVGYHLGLAGAAVTYLVRPGRAAALAAPQRLYCYDDGSLKSFDGFRVVDDVAALAGDRFDFALITVDGHTSRTEEGTTLLRALGDVVRAGDAVVIMCGFGVGVREHHRRCLAVPDEWLLHGFVGMTRHQTAADLPAHPPADPALLDRVVVAYRHPRNRTGFRLDTGNKAAAAEFAALYHRSGVSRCVRMSRAMDEIFCTVGFPVYAACEFAGWPDVATVAGDTELWRLACCARPRS